MAWFFQSSSSVTVPVLFILLNVVSCVSMGIDKHCAISGRRRISERNLILVALPFAALGSIVGMRLFRHKTRHSKFVYGMPALLILQATVSYIAFRLWF